MKAAVVYHLEKRFGETMALMQRFDPQVRQTPSSTFTIAMPNPVLGEEYVLCSYNARNAPREFKDIGRAVKVALRMGAKSIHFDNVDLGGDDVD